MNYPRLLIFFLLLLLAAASVDAPAAEREAHFIPDDVIYSKQWHLPGIQAPAAWDISRGNPKVIIAVLDAGVDASHPNWNGKQISGYNFMNNTPDATSDRFGHGTMIAGIAAAPMGTGGVVGVCPNCSIMSVVVANDKGKCDDSALVRGIRYAADHGANVINISYGSNTANPKLKEAVDYAWSKGAIIVASAGNDGRSSMSYPAAYANVISVSATDANNKPAPFTAFGKWIDVSAPGVGIVTIGLHGKFASGSGTSFSAAIISGLAGLIFSENPDLTNSQVANIIIQYSDKPENSGFDPYYGFGRANLQKALSETASLSRPDSSHSEDSIARFQKRTLALTRLLNKSR